MARSTGGAPAAVWCDQTASERVFRGSVRTRSRPCCSMGQGWRSRARARHQRNRNTAAALGHAALLGVLGEPAHKRLGSRSARGRTALSAPAPVAAVEQRRQLHALHTPPPTGLPARQHEHQQSVHPGMGRRALLVIASYADGIAVRSSGFQTTVCTLGCCGRHSRRPVCGSLGLAPACDVTRSAIAACLSSC